jgi:hypothetical protein
MKLLGILLAMTGLYICLSADAQNLAAHASELEPSKELLTPPLCKMHVVRRIGQHKGYSVDVRYPQFTGGSRPAIRKLNRTVKRIVDMNIEALPADAGNYAYECDFTKSLVTSRFISLNFEFSGDFRGNNEKLVEVPLNAQIYPQFKRLELEDLLSRNVNYKKLKSRYLEEQDDLRQIGVKPYQLQKEYFSNFTFDKHGLTFRMPQGAFPEALACPTATIPYKKLNRLINNKSPVRELTALR